MNKCLNLKILSIYNYSVAENEKSYKNVKGVYEELVDDSTNIITC